ncbi:MAG: hypothetical protein R3A52_05675 [Polyangiales bacterium]
MTLDRRFLLALGAVAAAGCGDATTGGNTVVDSGATTDRGAVTDTGNPGTDAGDMDSGAPTDAGGQTDATRSDARADAGPPYDPCMGAVDLSAMGMRSGETTRITSNNRMVGAMAPLRAPCGGTTGHQVVFRYTPRASTRLRISTDNPGTDNTLDTVVWAQPGPSCASLSPEGGTALGCDDDSGGTSAGGDAGVSRAWTSSFTTASVTAGQPIYIVVGAWISGSTGLPLDGHAAQGQFELSVTEITTVAAGGACDPMGVMNSCAMGTTCITAGSASTCVADGAAGGRCRATGAACDSGLACSGSQTSSSSRCRMTVAMGGACDPMGVMNVCAAGTSCVTAGGSSTCQAPPYAESPIASPMFVDACAMGTRVMLAGSSLDDNHAMAAITIPWSFQFYGTGYTAIWPSTNGYAVFGTTAPMDRFSATLPLTTEGPLAAPFFADLVLRAMNSGICTATVGAAPNRRLVVEWQDAQEIDTDSTHLTFELILNESGNTVDFLYQRLDPTTGADAAAANGSAAAIGLQGAMGARPTVHAGTVSTAAGIRFSPR